MTETSAVPHGSSALPVAPARARVLLVEDDEGDAFLVRELLLDAGADIDLVRARSLSEAHEHLPGPYQCVLLDLGLPDAQGLEALRTVDEFFVSVVRLPSR